MVAGATEGRCTFSPAIRARLANLPGRRVAPGNPTTRPPLLTPRELEVLVHIGSGKTVREAAAAMGLAANTVDNHKTRIMRKVNVHSVAELTRYAIREGHLEP